MPFWSTQRIHSEQQRFGNLVAPFTKSRIKQGAYELGLSREVITTPRGNNGEKLGKGPTLEIPPGQFALLYTEEIVSIPPEVIAFISIKATVKLDGLVNISGFHVDPGFSGRLKFSVYNAGNLPIFLEYGRETFLLWFAEFDSAVVDPYAGNHKNQNRILPLDRQRMAEESHSPAALDHRLEAVEKKITWVFAAAAAVATGIILPNIGAWTEHRKDTAPSQLIKSDATPTPTPAPATTPRP